MDVLEAPSVEEVELSTFGPGYGECILIQIPGGDWLIVDSCIDKSSKKPAALEYLSKIGIDFDRVKLIVATHWHDDHIRGLSETVKSCYNAELCFSSSLANREFIQLASTVSGNSLVTDGSGIDEFNNSLTEIIYRNKRPIFASEGMLIWRNSTCEVHALSPSHYSRLQVMAGYKDLLPKRDEPKKAIVASVANINEIAVVLMVKIGDFSILLGSDLEESGSIQTGWSAIVSSSTRPQEKASIFKIPHHGSQNGHSDAVWKQLLNANPLAVCTPYNKKIILPQKTDVDRIQKYTENAHITSKLRARGLSSKNDSTVQKTIKESGIKFKSPPLVTGHVRCRWNGTDLLVDHFNGAGYLKEHLT